MAVISIKDLNEDYITDVNENEIEAIRGGWFWIGVTIGAMISQAQRKLERS
ncbi:hypothetical protein Nos7524_3160 [Nostoc sp. PCC 7524]|uniref:hypothetical protein n=1 Tax=Nostoc sp. (strain ATCC 29411 / PCC 7524) TaxID=28072 RepID=UPI00029ED15B|nr:hypothetical protein [Nostoc sp. PCC 7524]AFY48963.1 hypothetical protein Nos7524_3160 [Nostoc sp. PCC 7524]